MAQMNRNVDVEELNSDALFGIQYLNYQTIPQKIIFFGSIVLAIAFMLIGNFWLQLNSQLTVLLMVIPIIPGILFGTNYNQDLSMIRYIELILFKPSKTLVSKPTEDVAVIRANEKKLKLEEEAKLKENKQSPAEQRKLLIKVITIFVICAVGLVTFLVAGHMHADSVKQNSVHHTVETTNNTIEGGVSSEK